MPDPWEMTSEQIAKEARESEEERRIADKEVNGLFCEIEARRNAEEEVVAKDSDT